MPVKVHFTPCSSHAGPQGDATRYLISTVEHPGQWERYWVWERKGLKPLHELIIPFLPVDKRLGEGKPGDGEPCPTRRVSDIVFLDERKNSFLAVDYSGRIVHLVFKEPEMEVIAWRHLSKDLEDNRKVRYPRGIQELGLEPGKKVIFFGYRDPTRPKSFVSLLSAGGVNYLRRVEAREEDCSLEIVSKVEVKATDFNGFDSSGRGYIWARRENRDKTVFYLYDVDFTLLYKTSKSEDFPDLTKHTPWNYLEILHTYPVDEKKSECYIGKIERDKIYPRYLVRVEDSKEMLSPGRCFTGENKQFARTGPPPRK